MAVLANNPVKADHKLKLVMRSTSLKLVSTAGLWAHCVGKMFVLM